MKNSDSSAGGYIVFIGLVAILAMPLVLGHFMIAKQPPVTVHAELSTITQ